MESGGVSRVLCYCLGVCCEERCVSLIFYFFKFNVMLKKLKHSFKTCFKMPQRVLVDWT